MGGGNRHLTGMAGAVLLSLALAGCGELPHPKTNLLPAQVSLLVETIDGEPLSILLGLRRNGRDQMDVRLSSGWRVYDGRHVFEILPATDGRTPIRELVHDTRADIPVDAPLVAVERGHAVFGEGDAAIRCALETRLCKPALGPPDVPLTHPGPAPGFRIALSGGKLRIGLPLSHEPRLVHEGVKRIVGVQWVRGEDDDAQEVLNRTFRGQATVRAAPRPATLDGALDDWAHARPTVVGAPWQLQSGARGWDGPRDGSFGIAASWTDTQACFAGRVRDDRLTAGDQLAIHLGGDSVVVPLLGPAPPEARLWDAWLGVGFEVCLPLEGRPVRSEMPFAATLVDSDDDLPPTVLATAPEADGRPLGHLALITPGTRPVAGSSWFNPEGP